MQFHHLRCASSQPDRMILNAECNCSGISFGIAPACNCNIRKQACFFLSHLFQAALTLCAGWSPFGMCARAVHSRTLWRSWVLQTRVRKVVLPFCLLLYGYLRRAVACFNIDCYESWRQSTHCQCHGQQVRRLPSWDFEPQLHTHHLVSTSLQRITTLFVLCVVV